jgi:tetratricopeptide (TPR) repeat protein/protein-L-isoaspartate O-methyltransferase
VLRQQGRFREAATELAGLVRRNPEIPELRLELGNLYQRCKQPAAAAKAFEAAIRLAPERAEAHYNLGVVHHRQGRQRQAEACYREAICRNRTFDPAHNNLGNLLFEEGRAEEAAAALDDAIDVNPQNADAHYNLANARKALNEIAVAVRHYREALRLRPGFTSALFNLGNTLLEANEAEAAIELYLRALRLQPASPRLHNNLGVTLRERGRLDEAAVQFNEVLKTDPGQAETLVNLGKTERDRGNLATAAACFAQALRLQPAPPNHSADNSADYLELLQTWASVARHARVAEESPEFTALLERCFASPQLDPDPLSAVAAHLLAQRHGLSDGAPEAIKQAAATVALDSLAKDSLLLAWLERAINVDGRMEQFLTVLRRRLLFELTTDKEASPSELRLAAALAHQGLYNEYVFYRDEEEERSLDDLKKRLESGLAAAGNAPERIARDLTVYMMYRSPAGLRGGLEGAKRLLKARAARQSPALRALLRGAVKEPCEEAEIASKLRRIGAIDDATSLAVATQYEENPVPRWRSAGIVAPINFARAFYRTFPHFTPPRFPSTEFLGGPIRILIAGGGTGRHPIAVARAFTNASVLAIDLSTASLAYAVRKADELGLRNIEFAQADILTLGQLNETFDIIECAGVLHHLKDPEKGLDALLGRLRDGGLIRIGLYSERARVPITAARERLCKGETAVTPAIIRAVRRQVLAQNKDAEFAALLKTNDFFTTSGCRDLLFHVCEHSFTLPQIKTMLDSRKLSLIGFELDDPMIAPAYRREFPKDPAMTDLEQWSRFEERHPRSFLGMYDFWCRKPLG